MTDRPEVPVPEPYSQRYFPPVPTRATRFLRTNLLWQAVRFLVLNAKMLRMVRKH